MKTFLSAMIGLLIAGIAGCTNPLQTGEAMGKYEKGKTPILQTAPQDGEYQLYSEMDKTPKMTVALKKGDPMGFKEGKTGQIVVVAGKQEVPMADQTLIWRLRKEK